MKPLKIFGIKFMCPEVAAFIILFLGDIKASIFAIFFLVLSDTATGIWAALKVKDKITSRKAGRIISKLLVYPLAIIVAKVTQVYLTPEIPWVHVTAGIIAIVEIKSVFENMSIILGYDLWLRIKEVIWKPREEAKKPN
jgi:phage-related holin